MNLGLPIVATLVLVACDPEVSVHGHVLDQRGKPIERAEVLGQCPDLCVYGLSDATGKLSGAQLGGCGFDCTLTVRHHGYLPLTTRVARHCVDSSGGVCHVIRLEARLKSDTTNRTSPPH
jgi:hypothetical protein